jgi:hypothetical protein
MKSPLFSRPIDDTPDTIEYTPDGKIRVATLAKLFQKLCDPQFEGLWFLRSAQASINYIYILNKSSHLISSHLILLFVEQQMKTLLKRSSSVIMLIRSLRSF